MDDLWRGFDDAKGPPRQTIAPGGDFDELPLLSQLMQGQLDSAGILWVKPPYKLLLWMYGPGCKWCLTAKEKWPKLWGTSSGLAQGLLGVEKAIKAGQCEWQRAEQSK